MAKGMDINTAPGSGVSFKKSEDIRRHFFPRVGKILGLGPAGLKG